MSFPSPDEIAEMMDEMDEIDDPIISESNMAKRMRYKQSKTSKSIEDKSEYRGILYDIPDLRTEPDVPYRIPILPKVKQIQKPRPKIIKKRKVQESKESIGLSTKTRKLNI